MINLLFGSKLTDCNSGFRAFRRDRLTTWNVSSPGMEFASELLVNALCAGAKIVEVPITLRCDRHHRQPHLQTWRDGMRHLLTILARAPWLFLHGGLAIVGLSLLIAALCAFGPRVVFGRFAVFDYHSPIFAVLLGFLGSQVLGNGVQLIELYLLQGEITEERGSKSVQLLGGFDQPLQHCVEGDLEDPHRSTNTQSFSQTCQDAHDGLDRGLFAVEKRAMRLQKVALA